MAKRRSKRVAVVHCGGGSTLLPHIVRDELPQDCVAILRRYPQGIQACRFSCLGGGSCALACKMGAINVGDAGVAKVERTSCIGCGACVRACPQHLIELVPVNNTIYVGCSNEQDALEARKVCSCSCIGCGICVRNCPAKAIELRQHRAQIDQELCIACGMCATVCPRAAIHDSVGIFTVD